MLELIGLALFGGVVACYGTLVGIGGGPMIVPLVAMLYPYDTTTIVAISVMVVFCNTLSGSIAYLRERRIDIVSAVKFGLVSIPGALLSVFALHYIHINAFSFLFGFFLILLASYIFLHPVIENPGTGRPFWMGRRTRSNSPKRLTFGEEFVGLPDLPQHQHPQRTIRDRSGNSFTFRVNERLGMGITAMIGVFSTFLGIGGGLIQVPALVYILSFPVHVATATSHLITAINSGFTLIPLMVFGAIPYATALPLAIGAVIGAQIGAKLSNRFDDATLLRLLIPVFILMGAKLMFFNF